MRDFLFKASIILGLVILLMLTSGVALAALSPFRPGNILFPAQYVAEQSLATIYKDPANKSAYLMDLAERRMDELESLAGSRDETIALRYLDRSIDQAMTSISVIPQDEGKDVRNRFTALIGRINSSIPALGRAPKDNETEFKAFVAKILALQQMEEKVRASPKEFDLNLPLPLGSLRLKVERQSNVNSALGLVPFPAGSMGAAHSFYPLIGLHASIPCEGCHDAGKYAGTAELCVYCHILEKPIPHFTEECALCHTPSSWNEIHFDHDPEAAENCSACHASEAPVSHYNGQCSACHITQVWNIVSFNHVVAEAVDCVACHSNVAPANHYGGQCSNCHSTDAPWANAQFNHSGFSDCKACHAGTAPANHYSGQCSNCHDPNSSWKNAQFDHSGLADCIACHANNAPSNHYQAQCSSCHSTNSWSGAHFTHDGLTDCLSCHANNRPREHDTGQCSQCHNTRRWEDD